MSSDWRKIELSELAIINPKRVIPRGAEAPFIDMAALPTDSRDIDNTPRQRIFKGGGSRFMNGDTLLARITPCLENGKTAFVNNLKDNTIGHGSTEFIVLSSKDPEDRKFIYYLVRGEAFRSYAIARMEGTSGRQRVPTDAVAKYTFSCPPKSIRSEISNFLCLFDDRITLLRETNKTLEAIAQAIYKSWFVDFDPVHAKAEGRAPEGMDEETAALFPDEFEESELGLVPKGWKITPFANTVQVIGGGTPKTSIPEYWNGDIPWFSVVDAPAFSDVWVINTERQISTYGLQNSSTKLLPPRTTIISARGTVGRLALTGRSMTMNQSCYALRGIADDSFFTYYSTRQLVNRLRQHAHGSVFSTITRATLSGISIAYPLNHKAIEAFDTTTEPLMQRILSNAEQSNSLAALRDTLLPRLISGKLRLPEAEAMVEEVI